MKDTKNQSDAAAFEEKALKTVRRNSLIPQGSRVIVALSGGKDSVALLFFLLRTAGITKITVEAAHLNHALRGSESDSDERFVRALCERLSVRLYCEKLCEGQLNIKGKSLEEAAREARYEFFARVARENGAALIATAHTASDNAETVLMNIMRGSALSGICGIPVSRENIIRPLRDMTSSEVVGYLSALGEDYVTDSSNLTDDYTRNQIRNRIIPLFKDKNPAFDSSLARLSELASYDCELIQRIADNEAERLGIDGNSDCADTDALRNLASDSAYSGVLYCILTRLTGPLSSERFYAFRSILLSDNPHGRVELGGKKEIILDAKTIKVVKSFGRAEKLPCYSLPLTPGSCNIEEISTVISLSLEKNSNNFEIIHTKNRILRFNYNAISGTMILRNRLPGDEIRMGGITKKLKKLFSERGIPSYTAAYFPVLCDEHEVIAVCGLGICDRVRISEKTTVACLEITSSPVFSLFDE